MARWIALVLVLLVWGGRSIAPSSAGDDDVFGKNAVKQFSILIKAHRYRTLRARMAAVQPKLADRSAALRAEFKALTKALTQAREQWLTESATAWFLLEVQAAIRLKVAAVKVRTNKVLAWAQTRLESEAFAAIAKRLKPLDDVSVEELRAAWGRRKKGAWQKIAMPRESREITAPWWKEATLAQRRERVLLVFVAKWGPFEIRSTLFESACSTCKGTGLERKRLAAGETLAVLCTNCRGVGHFDSLGFR